jgi:TonB-linked SusC/RagA family outer membrane protein
MYKFMKKKQIVSFLGDLKGHKLILKMKLSILILLGFLTQVSASVYSQATKFSFVIESKQVVDVLKTIEAKSDFRFFYQREQVDVTRMVNLNVTDKSVEEILSELFKDQEIRYKVLQNNLILLSPDPEGVTSISEQQQKSVSGKVTDPNGTTLPGVSVVLKGTTSGVITDSNGNFTLSNVPENSILQFSFVGMKTKEIKIGTESVIHVVLVEETVGIEEVVAIGYGTSRKKDLTGAVIKVDTKKMETMVNINPVQTMRGTVAGVNVVDNGRPGSDGSITIRGRKSISASNDPLIVLDGIPYTGGRLSDINANDIESIDILKDASSAAIYGSRATNGVILITTKKGTSTKPRLNYNTYYGRSDFARTPKYMGPEKYIQLKKDAEAYKGQPVQLQPLEQANFDAGITIDPWQEIKQDAPVQSHELNFSGKNETVAYYISGSFTDAKSPIMGDNFSRLSFRANFDVKVTDWIKIGTNSGYSFKDYSGNQADLYFASYVSPYANLYYDDGVPRPQPMNLGLVWNPLSSTLMSQNKEITQTLFGNFYTDINLPLKGLTYRLNVGTTQRIDQTNNYNPSFSREQYFNLGSGSKYHYKAQSLTVENILKYNRVFAQKHSLDLTLMYGIETLDDEASSLSSDQIFNDALGWNSLEVGQNFKISSSAGKSHAASAMGRIGYRYGDKYMLNFTVRRDGYSAFGAGEKYGVFPSIGLGWNLSEEGFMENIKWLDQLKIRASYGKNGNRGIGRYASLSKMSQQNYVFGDGAVSAIGLYPTSMANPDLGWETTVASNIGVDYNILNNRFSGSVEYYHMDTKDLLLARRIPNMTGYESFITNIGGTSNDGVELTLNTENVKKGGFLWTTSFVFSANRNKITHLTGADLNGDGKEDDDIANKWFIGEPLGSNYDYVWDGIWQTGDAMSLDPGAKPGYIKFKDISGPAGIPDGKIGPEDRKVLHSNNPDFIAGLTNTFSYQGLSLSILFNTSQGGYRSNGSLNIGTTYFDAANVMDLPYWTPTNPLTDRPSVGYPNPRGYGFYESVSFVRLQDLTLGYEFPKALISKIRLNNCKVYISGKNLATWTKWHGWDPEHGAGGRGDQYAEDNGPMMKSWTIGINLGL